MQTWSNNQICWFCILCNITPSRQLAPPPMLLAHCWFYLAPLTGVCTVDPQLARSRFHRPNHLHSAAIYLPYLGSSRLSDRLRLRLRNSVAAPESDWTDWTNCFRSTNSINYSIHCCYFYYCYYHPTIRLDRIFLSTPYSSMHQPFLI